MKPVRDLAMDGLVRGLTELLSRQAPAHATALGLAVRSLLAEQERGYIGLSLEHQHLQALWTELDQDASPDDPGQWLAALRGSGLLGSPDDGLPLVESCGHLYFRRQFALECRIADQLRALAESVPALQGSVQAAQWDACFSPDVEAPDWQRVAAWVAMQRRLTVITGGPGTGKTATLVRLLALLRAQQPALRIALAAPTGKAAQRMSEAALNAIDALGRNMPDLELPEAQTVHRLLGIGARRRTPRFHRDRPLPLDVIAVDEVSMLDAGLMLQLLDAIPAGARLILLGDPYQLQSVEAGSVLYDLCAEPAYPADFVAALQRDLGVTVGSEGPDNRAGVLASSLVRLRKSWRFGADSGLGGMAAAVLDGDYGAVRQLLDQGGELQWVSRTAGVSSAQLARFAGSFDPVIEAARLGQAEVALAALGRYRILAAVRGGPVGVDRLNQRMEQRLSQHAGAVADGPWFAGRTVMIRVNDYRLRLFNGDVGVAVVTEAGLRIAFQASAGLRLFVPAQLPAHEPAFVMTIHKSQGSEFDSVSLVLPEASSPLLNRSLLYTGITRARNGVRIHAAPAALLAAVVNAPQRISALRERLWQ